MRISRGIFITVISVVLALVCIFNLRGFIGEITEKVLTKVGIVFFSEFHQYKDWYYDLPYGYMISDFGATRTCVVKDDEIFISGDVIRFCYNDSYLGAERKMTYSDIQQSNSDLNAKEDSLQIKYYLLEFDTGKCYGPMDKKDYSEKCNELKIDNLNEWIDTSPVPEGAYCV